MSENQQISTLEPRELNRDLERMSTAASFMATIERVALMPGGANVEVMKQLFALQEQIEGRNAKAAFNSAFADMQPELPTITETGGIKNAKGDIQSTYAKWEDINEAIMPVLGRHGFSIRHRISQANGKITVTGILSHRDGHSEEAELELPVDKTGSKNDVQAIGSSVQYGQRYTTKALVNIRSRFMGDLHLDDDGASAGADPLTSEQLAQVHVLLDETKSDVARFCKFMGVETVDGIPASQFKRAVDKLKQKKAQSA